MTTPQFETIHAETYAAHPYAVDENRPRLFDRTAEPERVVLGYRCPRCSTLHEMEHFSAIDCECGLHLTLHGNCLEASLRIAMDLEA